MNLISFYILVGAFIFIGGVILFLLKRDNARQEKIIRQHNRDIALIKNSQKK
ncbi:hypothetical protein [Gramella sp. KN1008]|uniref:hypothetical protein n=1 Tax=Gramella sp. KN1008 TaxID=2529298 RepID=UPI0013F167FD|nr:hypothetical protein [Gramella sp. KN1008]